MRSGNTSLAPALAPGESDAIRRALQAPERSLRILDDRVARRQDSALGLNLDGTVRLLAPAGERG